MKCRNILGVRVLCPGKWRCLVSQICKLCKIVIWKTTISDKIPQCFELCLCIWEVNYFEWPYLCWIFLLVTIVTTRPCILQFCKGQAERNSISLRTLSIYWTFDCLFSCLSCVHKIVCMFVWNVIFVSLTWRRHFFKVRVLYAQGATKIHNTFCS